MSKEIKDRIDKITGEKKIANVLKRLGSENKNVMRIHSDDKHWLDSFNSYWDCEYENDEEVSLEEIVEVNVIEDVYIDTAVERFNSAFTQGPAIKLLEVE